MGGVDKLDQMTRQNKAKKSMKWYRRIERKLMETSLYNAYVIEGHVIDHKVDNVIKRDFLSFRLDLVHQLVQGQYVDKTPAGRPRSEAHANDPRLDRMDHWPVKGVGSDHRCQVCVARHKNYKRLHPGAPERESPFKERKTTMMCEKCQVYLCCNQYDCFKIYHTRVTYV